MRYPWTKTRGLPCSKAHHKANGPIRIAYVNLKTEPVYSPIIGFGVPMMLAPPRNLGPFQNVRLLCYCHIV